MKPERLLVCGGRDYWDWDFFDHCMTPWRERAFIIQGGALGADFMASSWALIWGCGQREYPAQWHKLGKVAGFRRNTEMLVLGKPDRVIAFPGGPGTADMVSRAQDRGFPVTLFMPGDFPHGAL